MPSPRRIRALVIDDEPLAREHIVAMLATEPDIEVVGEAGGGAAAIQLIGSAKPDLVFLDVQMPGCDGFEVLAGVAAVHMPAVVFVTAYDAHAVRAFNVAAVDYVLKPVQEPRLRTAVRRAVDHLTHTSADDIKAQLAPLIANMRPVADRIPVASDGRVTFVNVHDIDWIDADDDSVRLHAGPAVHSLGETMAAMEQRLPAGFVRIHRSIIVNTNRVREIQPWFKGDYVLVLHDGTKLTSGRTYQDRVRALIK